DSARSTAIVVAAPSFLHSLMAGELIAQIRDEGQKQGVAALSSGISTVTDATSTRATTHGLTTRAWDNALQYEEDNGTRLMIAVEVGVSQTSESLRAAISWCVCGLGRGLGIAMSIHEVPRRRERAPIQHYSSTQEANEAVAATERDLHRQLVERPYGPLISNGVTWFGRVQHLILETYRAPLEVCPSETLLEPTQSFRIIDDGEFVGDNVPSNLREVVLGDCIPSHILTAHGIEETPINFFRRGWFEAKFGHAMVSTAINRI
ncbi:hypothetical protein V1505DRAFT_289635, partial [Lipomyces doorenjongii]